MYTIQLQARALKLSLGQLVVTITTKNRVKFHSQAINLPHVVFKTTPHVLELFRALIMRKLPL